MSDDCRKCQKIVRPRQEAICCSTCERWTHRTCGTGISRQLCRQLVKAKQEVEWWCDGCGVPASVEPDNSSDISLDESAHASMNSTGDHPPIAAPRNTAPIAAPRNTAPIAAPRNTASIAAQRNTAPIAAPRNTAPIAAPRNTAPIAAPRNTAPIAAPMNTAPSQPSPSTPMTAMGRTLSTSTPEGNFHISFNVSDISMESVEVHRESDLADATAMDISVVEDVAVTYQIVDGGTKRGGWKLVSSDGYSYTVKKTTKTSTAWRCSVRCRYINEVLGDLSVRSIVMDFEAAVWSAVKALYKDVDIMGCYFHWAQAVMRKVQSLGLKTTYCEKKGLYVFIQQLLGLPYLPPGHIERAFQSLTAKLPCPEVEDLVSYLENAWLHNPNWSVRQWSVFRQSIRTNNDCEGWHRRLNGKAGRAMLHFYLLVPLLRKEANSIEVTMRLVEEQTITRHRRTQNRLRETKVEQLWNDYESQSVRTSAFLRGISRLCAPGFPD
ncbi:uncharacterized protein LOC117317302 [Pecten maximus]|uniref:uncharacterized protein LOC117317302 n=1 Tax=Pecten maximus TaxID=6579 RepID=UPI00145814BD|nr:uncharacterized protein LOC117317302 [Pecten maximus]